MPAPLVEVWENQREVSPTMSIIWYPFALNFRPDENNLFAVGLRAGRPREAKMRWQDLGDLAGVADTKDIQDLLCRLDGEIFALRLERIGLFKASGLRTLDRQGKDRGNTSSSGPLLVRWLNNAIVTRVIKA